MTTTVTEKAHYAKKYRYCHFLYLHIEVHVYIYKIYKVELLLSMNITFVM